MRGHNLLGWLCRGMCDIYYNILKVLAAGVGEFANKLAGISRAVQIGEGRHMWATAQKDSADAT